MTWLRIDDHFDEHPKVMICGPAALGLWLVCATYCARQKPRSGFIPRSFIGRVMPHHSARNVAQLVEAGLWEEAEGGWVIHDFSEYGPPSELSEKRAAAGSKGGRTTQANVKQTSSKRSSKNQAKGYPEPVPVPVNALSPKVDKALGADQEQLVETWNRNCGDLPRIRGVPKSGEIRQGIDRALDYFKGDLGALGASVQRAAGDEHYRTNRFGLVTWARHLDRWDDPAGSASLTSGERAWAESIDEWRQMPKLDKLGNPKPNQQLLTERGTA